MLEIAITSRRVLRLEYMGQRGWVVLPPEVGVQVGDRLLAVRGSGLALGFLAQGRSMRLRSNIQNSLSFEILPNRPRQMQYHFSFEGEPMELKCSMCRVQACSSTPGTKTFPVFCPASQELDALPHAHQLYQSDPEIQRLALSAARVEADGYCRWPRVQEVMEFAHGIGAYSVGHRDLRRLDS